MEVLMLFLLAIPVIVAVAFVYQLLQGVAPSNLIVRSVRAARPSARIAASLLGLAATLLLTMRAVASAVAAGAPGWLNLIVLVLAWDTIKFGSLAIAVLLRTVRRQAQS